MKITEYKVKIVDDLGNEFEIASDAPAADPVEESIYAEDGFSKEAKFGCCYRNQGLDQWLDSLIADGDEYEKAFAESAPRWFCLRLPSREPYDDFADQVLKMNWMRVQKYGMSPQMVLMGFKQFAEDNELIDGIVTPIRYFNPSKVHEYLEDGVKYVWRNAIEYSRTGGRAGWGK